MRIDEFPGLNLQPALLLRLAVQFRARVGCGERNLDRFGVDIAGKPDGLLDRLGSLARKTENEGSVNLDSEIAGVA